MTEIPHRQRRPLERHHEILDAALAEFAEKGFLQARIKDIAKRAGISTVALYKYFPSKEDIFKSLVEESVGMRVRYLAQMADGFEGSSADAIRLILRGIGAFLTSSNRVVLPKLIWAETNHFPELVAFYKREVTDRGIAIFEALIARGIARGEFRPVNLRQGAQLILVPAMFTAIWRTGLGRFESEPLDVESFIETHLDLILRGLAADGPSN